MGGRHQQDRYHGWTLTSEVQSEAVRRFLPAGSRNPVVSPTLVWLDEALRHSYVSLQLLRCCTIKLESLLLEKIIGFVPVFHFALHLCTCWPVNFAPHFSLLSSVSAFSLFDTQVRPPRGCVSRIKYRNASFIEIFP